MNGDKIANYAYFFMLNLMRKKKLVDHWLSNVKSVLNLQIKVGYPEMYFRNNENDEVNTLNVYLYKPVIWVIIILHNFENTKFFNFFH